MMQPVIPPLPKKPIVAKRMICGKPKIHAEVVSSAIMKYYRDDGNGYLAGPPVEAMDTANVDSTGKWRIVGDVDRQTLQVEIDIDWKITPRKLKWRFGWPMSVVEDGAPDIHGTTVWVGEDAFDWLTPDNEQMCGCDQNQMESE